jgi:phosphoglycolate phosphatase
MIGDRKHDIIGGKKYGLFTIGVTWGYGSREELENSGADIVVDSPAVLQTFLLRYRI